MKDWRLWDWISYAALWVSGVIIAVDAALKSASPSLKESVGKFIDIDGKIWAFAPGSLIIFGTIILIIRYSASNRKDVPELYHGSSNLELRVFSGSRMPQELSNTNVWRWYYLKNSFIQVDLATGQQKISIVTNLFISFNVEVNAGTLLVLSHESTLPPHEVKEFNSRFAIIAFSGELGDVTLYIQTR